MEYNDTFETEAFRLIKIGDKYDYNWAHISKWLSIKFLSKGPDYQFSEIDVNRAIDLIEHINSKFSWYNSLEAPIPETLAETLKAFRIIVLNEEVARYLLGNSRFRGVIYNLACCLLTKKNGPELFTKYLLQLFLNLLVVGSDEQRMQAKLFMTLCFSDIFISYFMGAYGHIFEASAILYNLWRDNDVRNEDLLNNIILYHGDPSKTNEYLDFLMEKLISSDSFWQLYEDLDARPRLTLLRCIKEVLISPNAEGLVIKIKRLSISCLNRLSALFIKSCNVVFQVTQAGSTNASQEVSYILEILAHVSSHEGSGQHLQTNKDLFINAGVLLLNIHRLGQMSNNVFTPIQKLTQNEQASGEMRNPVFGFKVDLVRLIGNLCYRNRMMQDLAREAEVIPVLLDCCNIDEKNPFIMQWVILAIRNICENNLENQAIIGGLTQQGVIESDTLKKYGLTLHTEEDLSIGMIGLNLNKQ